jgi:hypothetical protein
MNDEARLSNRRFSRAFAAHQPAGPTRGLELGTVSYFRGVRMS